LISNATSANRSAHGRWATDAGVLAQVSSANIACGSTPAIRTRCGTRSAFAVQAGVAVGAHVSLPDLQGFGAARK